MNREELRKFIRGPIGTMPTAFDHHYRVDLDAMASLTQWLVDNGMTADNAPLKVAAAMSEGHALTDEEWPRVLRTVVDAAGGKAKVLCGLKAKGTLATIEDAKKAQDLGAIGLQIDLPYLFHPNQDDMVRFYTEISDAIDIGIMVYNSWWWGSPFDNASLTAESILRLSDAEHVVAIKWNTPNEMDYDDMRKFSSIFNVIDNSSQVARCYKNRGSGFIDSTTAAYPAHALKVQALLEAERYEEAQSLFDSVDDSITQFKQTLHRSGGYRVEKAIWTILGHPVGPPRPPILPLSDEEMHALRNLVSSWGWPIV